LKREVGRNKRGFTQKHEWSSAKFRLTRKGVARNWVRALGDSGEVSLNHGVKRKSGGGWGDSGVSGTEGVMRIFGNRSSRGDSEVGTW